MRFTALPLLLCALYIVAVETFTHTPTLTVRIVQKNWREVRSEGRCAPPQSKTLHLSTPLRSTPLHSSIDGDEEVVQDYFMKEDRMQIDLEDCILVGVEDLSHHRLSNQEKDVMNFDHKYTLQESLTEMRELITTAGLRISGEITQRLNDPNPRTYIGTGKVQDITKMCQELKCCTVGKMIEIEPHSDLHKFSNPPFLSLRRRAVPPPIKVPRELLQRQAHRRRLQPRRHKSR